MDIGRKNGPHESRLSRSFEVTGSNAPDEGFALEFCNVGWAQSHTRTVVRECCKVDDASQWDNGKFDHLPRPNPLTDRHKKLHT